MEERKEVKALVFLSNYFNHHQKPLSDALYSKLGDGYTFIETEVMEEERKNLGWTLESLPSYVVTSAELAKSPEKYETLVNTADAVIIGSASEVLIRRRKKLGGIIFRYRERPLRKGIEIRKYIPRFVRWHCANPKNKPIYLLCASAYTASDFRKFGLFQDKAFKWGYFPETKRYDDIDLLLSTKKKNSIIWVARYIPLKHPEYVLGLARRLLSRGYDFEIEMIGNGELFDSITYAVREEGLEKYIKTLGVLKPEEVRAHMEKAEIHIFTSDKREGWGAVLNESMNSACVPVADMEIGAVPYLVKDCENGFVYRNKEEFYERVEFLLREPEKRQEMAISAYKTIVNEWNAERAAEKVLTLSAELLSGNAGDAVFPSGVCSTSK